MTTYPGDDPQQPDDPQDSASWPPESDAPTPDGTEPTQPVGYWERRAGEQAAEQARTQGGQPYPTTPYPQGGPVFDPTSSQQNPYAQTPYARLPRTRHPRTRGSTPKPLRENPYAQSPYPQPGPAAYGGQPPGFPTGLGRPSTHAPMPPLGGFVVRPPDHPQATLALVLGLVGVVGAFIFCGVTLAGLTVRLGRRPLLRSRTSSASQGQVGGESQARTGMILGIVGTALLALGRGGPGHHHRRRDHSRTRRAPPAARSSVTSERASRLELDSRPAPAR